MQTALVGPQISPEKRQKFLALYPNRAHHIYKSSRDPKWKYSRVQLFTGMIDSAIALETQTFYGALWAELTKFAVIDLDETSEYHNAQALRHLRETLSSCGLARTCVYQSSESTGWHLYIPFDDWAPSKRVEAALKAFLKLHGFEIRGGQLEVFPSGNGLRLPLQRGFAWLDADCKPMLRREEIDQDTAVSRFLFEIEQNQNNWAAAESEIESQLQAAAASAGVVPPAHEKAIANEGFDDLFISGKIQENWEKGRQYWKDGLTASGQRHDAVLFVGHYLWYGDAETGIAPLPGARNDEYRAALIEDWLLAKHNGFCRHLDEQKLSVIRAQIKRAVLWRPNGAAKDYEPYRLTDRLLKRLLALYRETGKVWTVEDFKQANDDRRDQARCKIRAAVEQCLSEGRQISRSTLQALTGCSPNTLKKHADLWRLFAIGSREYNPGGLGGLSLVGPSGSQVSDPVLEQSDSLGEKSEIGASIQDGCSPNAQTEISAQGTSVLRACSPVLYGRWRRRGKATGRKLRKSLASPSRTQPSTGSKHRLLRAGGTCGLNGCLPACGSPPFKSSEALFMGSSSVLLQEGASSRGPPQRMR